MELSLTRRPGRHNLVRDNSHNNVEAEDEGGARRLARE
jgi:hypothetical protein